MNKKECNMRIVHILPSFKGGGIQNFLFSLVPEQVKMGHEVMIVVTDEDNIDYSIRQKELLEQKGVKVFNLDRKVSDKKSFFKTILKARKLIARLSPDIVNSHAAFCHTIASLATWGTKSIHCCTIHSAPEVWSRMAKLINRRKPLIFCSDSALILKGQTGNPMIAINNGVEIDKIRVSEKVSLHDELNIPQEDKIVVLVGSPRPPKNYPFLIEIVEKLRDEHIHFCICGGTYKVAKEGNNNKFYISLEQFEKYKNIHLLGLRSDVPAILNGSDVYLSCSVREGLPISALEAFFSGIPCVLSPILQHTMIAKGIDGCYIPEKFEAEMFVDAIRQALECKETHDEIFRKREEGLKKFSIQRCASEYIEFYERLLSQNG